MNHHHPHTRFFKAAVALSNTGVTLLERHCYHDALVTIRDALFLVRAAFPGDEYKQAMWKEGAIHFALRRASHCLARSLPVDERKQAGCNLKVLSDNQSCPTEVVRAINEAEVFAVRIDDSRYDYDCVSPIQSEVSIILLNYATACRCLQSSDRTTPNNPSSLLHEAFNILRMAHGILARQYCVLPLKHAPDEFEASRMIGITVIVLHNLIQLCVQLAMPVQQLDYFGNKLGRIMEAFIRLNDDLPCWSYTHTAPSA